MLKLKFFKNNNLKKTEVGEIPKDWEVKRLLDVVNVVKGTEPGSKNYRKKGDVRFIRVSDLSKNILEKIYLNTNEVKNLTIVNENDVLLVLDGIPGIVAMGYNGAISSGIRKLNIKDKNKLHNKFLYYILQINAIQKIILYYATGTTIKHASKSISYIKIPLPPLDEQKAIAKVLKDFDDLLEIIEEKIKTFEKIKKKLMEIYFTKGVFEHKEFKDTELGRIPKDWKVIKLEEIAKIESGNTAPQKEKYFKNGKYPFIRMQHLNFLSKNRFIKYFDLINDKAVKELKLKLFKKGSILLPKSGESIRTEKKAMLSLDSYVVNHLAIIEVKDKSKLNNEYLFYYFKRFKLSSLIMQTTTPSIKLSTLRNIKIPLPSLEEQKEIAKRLKVIDNQIENLKNQKETLQKIKKKFMDLLLTGKIRVKEV